MSVFCIWSASGEFSLERWLGSRRNLGVIILRSIMCMTGDGFMYRSFLVALMAHCMSFGSIALHVRLKGCEVVWFGHNAVAAS